MGTYILFFLDNEMKNDSTNHSNSIPAVGGDEAQNNVDEIQ